MSQSPRTSVNSDELDEYLEGWNTLSSMLRRGGSLSGREANCCYLNLGGAGERRFADASAVSGFNDLDDGRALALVDWDLDGDLDLWTANRTGPRIRVLENNVDAHNRRLTLKLQGRTCNRDAIGARVEVVLNTPQTTRMIRTVRAGDSYLTQSSRLLHFGLGDAESIDHVRVYWPGEKSFEEFTGMEVNGRYLVVQGDSMVRPIELAQSTIPDAAAPNAPLDLEPLPQRVLVVGRWPLPPMTVQSADGAEEPLYNAPGRPLLVNFWASWCGPCLEELAEWTRRSDEIDAAGLDVVALSARNPEKGPDEQTLATQEAMQRLNFPYRWRMVDEGVVQLTDEVLAAINLDYQRPFGVPSSILLDRHGQVAAIYRGAVDLDVILRDVELVDATPVEVRDAAAPFDGVWMQDPPRPAPTAFASKLDNDGRSDLAEAYWRHLISLAETTGDGPYAISDEWRGAAAFALSGSLLRQGNLGESMEFSRQAIQLRPNDYRPRANLGAALLQMGDAASALEQLDAALKIRPNRASVLTNRATAHQQLGRIDLAIADWEATLELTPEDTTARTRVAAASLSIGDERRAIRHYRRLLDRDPGSIDIVGALAWLMATSPDPEARDGASAKRYAQQWVDATGGRDPKALNALAAALAENGEFEAAVEALSSAIRLGQQQNDAAMLRAFAPRLELYQQGKPFHRPARP